MTMLHAPKAHHAKPARLPARQEASIEDFFQDYATQFNRALRGERVDADEVADSFAPYFVAASPRGLQGGQNGLFLRWMIPRGFAHHRRMGTRAMVLRRVEIEPIDEQVASARVHWDAHYQKQDGSREHIEFDVVYLLHLERGRPRIFAYVHGNEERALAEHGLS